MKKAFIIITGILFLVLSTLTWIIYQKYSVARGYDIDKTLYPITGIDVSQHTGDIDFKIIKEDSIDFVYMKSTEGGDYKDPFFEQNYKNAREVGLILGCYHLFRYNIPGSIQAQNYLNAIKNKHLDLPLVADVEEGKPGEEYIREVVIAELKIFIKELKNAGYPYTIIYTNKKNHTIFIDEELKKYDLWIAHLDKNPSDKFNWLFWQHWLNKRIPGAEGHVDINTFNGSREKWIQFLNRN